jgi:type II secretory pathway pseudopilin PulG
MHTETWFQRRSARGLTMIELLTVVALLGLIVAVVVAFVFPSDDRRVKLEAEKLAAYLERAGGDAKMTEGAVRVAFAFDDGDYHREVATMGARISDLAWREDERVRPDRIKAPVRILAVEVTDVGALESGTAWLVWEDTKTRGGVVVIGLNESVWSVVVDPKNGAVRLERGRIAAPAGGEGFKRSLPRAELTSLTDGTEVDPGALQRLIDNIPTGPRTESEIGDTPPPNTGGTPVPAAGGSLVPPDSPPPIFPPEPPLPPPTAPPPEEPPETGGEPAPPTEPPAEPSEPPGDPCAQFQCPDKHGLAQMCVTSPGEDSTEKPRCVPDVRGKAYLANNFRLAGFLRDYPQADLAEEVISVVLNDFSYKFMLAFPAQGAASRGFSALDFSNHLVQGARQVSGRTYRGMQNLTTSTRARVILDAPESTNEDESGAIAAWYMWPQIDTTVTVAAGGQLRTQRGDFTLTVPFTRNGEPCFWRMTTVIGIVAVLLPIDDGHHKLGAILKTCLGAARANIPLGGSVGGATTLSGFLETISEPLCDSNGDEDPDGWPIEVFAQMQAVEFADDPARYEGAPISPACN